MHMKFPVQIWQKHVALNEGDRENDSECAAVSFCVGETLLWRVINNSDSALCFQGALTSGLQKTHSPACSL